MSTFRLNQPCHMFGVNCRHSQACKAAAARSPMCLCVCLCVCKYVCISVFARACVPEYRTSAHSQTRPPPSRAGQHALPAPPSSQLTMFFVFVQQLSSYFAGGHVDVSVHRCVCTHKHGTPVVSAYDVFRFCAVSFFLLRADPSDYYFRIRRIQTRRLVPLAAFHSQPLQSCAATSDTDPGMPTTTARSCGPPPHRPPGAWAKTTAM